SAQGELQHLGARLRAQRFAESQSYSWKHREPHGSRSTERRRRGAILSVDLLVFDDEDSRQERIRRQGENSREADAERISELDEVERLSQLPCDRQPLHAHVSHQRAVPLRQVRQFRGAVVSPHPSGQGGVPMFATAVKAMGGAPFRYLADCTERIAKGE